MQRAIDENRHSIVHTLGLVLALVASPAAATDVDIFVPGPEQGENAGFPVQVRVEQPKLPTPPIEEPSPPVAAISHLLDVEVLPPLERMARSPNSMTP